MAGKRIESVGVQVTSPSEHRLRTGEPGVKGISVLIRLKLKGEVVVEIRFHNLVGYRRGKPAHIELHAASRDRMENWATGLGCEEPEAVTEAVEQALKNVLNPE